jgi:hypothetical protein
MRIEFTQELKDISGSNIVDDDGKNVTLATVAIGSLLAITENTNTLSGTKKAHRGVLAHEIYTKNVVDMEIEDVAMLKECIAEVYGPLVVFRAYELLDPKVKEVKGKSGE